MKDYKRTADDFNEYLRLDEGRSGDAGRFRDFLRSIGYEPLY